MTPKLTPEEIEHLNCLIDKEKTVKAIEYVLFVKKSVHSVSLTYVKNR